MVRLTNETGGNLHVYTTDAKRKIIAILLGIVVVFIGLIGSLENVWAASVNKEARYIVTLQNRVNQVDVVYSRNFDREGTRRCKESAGEVDRNACVISIPLQNQDVRRELVLNAARYVASKTVEDDGLMYSNVYLDGPVRIDADECGKADGELGFGRGERAREVVCSFRY